MRTAALLAVVSTLVTAATVGVFLKWMIPKRRASANLSEQEIKELLEEGDIYGLEEFLTGVDDERTREAVIELLEAKQIADEKVVAMRMRRIIRQLPDDVIDKLFEIYKKTFPRR
ncbi:hypothetical protein RB195_020710 [Necator americanus]|uniref:CARD domain-containing protein n=1 Tax=Necator americanus TaxID=51031 RepID=A0ABR1CKD4_NECAM